MIKNAPNVDRTTNSSILEQHSCFCDIFQNSTLCYRVREVKHRKFIYFDSCLTRFFNIVSSLFVCLFVWLFLFDFSVYIWFPKFLFLDFFMVFLIYRVWLSNNFFFQKFLVWFQSRCFSKWDLLIFQTMLLICKICPFDFSNVTFDSQTWKPICVKSCRYVAYGR